MSALGITLDELVASLRARRTRLPAEVGAFVLLEACEALLRGPAKVRSLDLRLGDDGGVSVFARPHSASPEDAAQSVIALLSTTLDAAGTGVPNGLLAILERNRNPMAYAGDTALVQLRDELEASLVPLNRAASRRVMARMIRDVKKFPIPAPEEQFHASGDEIDEALDHFLDAPTGARRGPEPRASYDPPAPGSEVHTSASHDPASAKETGGGSIAPTTRGGDETPELDDEDALIASHARELDALLRGNHPDSGSVELDTVIDAPGEPVLRPSRRPREPTRPYEMERLGAFSGEGSRSFATEAPRAATGSARPAGTAQPLGTSGDDTSSLDMDSLPAARHESRRGEPSGGEPSRDGLTAAAPESDTTATEVPKFAQTFDDEYGLEERPRRSSAGPWLAAFIAVVVVTAGLLAWMRPDLMASLGGAPDASVQSETEPSPEPVPPGELYGTLTVRSEPAPAQVLLYAGRGPAVVEDLPTGMTHELIAIADGFKPSRALVPADADWQDGPNGPRYELAIQSIEAGDGSALGESLLERGTLGTPSARMGSVRVITNPPGAKVYLLIGFTPEVRVENVRTDSAIELLVYAPGFDSERHIVGPSDWQGQPGSRSAEVEVSLRESP